MLIRVGHQFSLRFTQPTPLVLLLSLHPSRDASLRRAESLNTLPGLPLTRYSDLYGNRCTRLLAPAGEVCFYNDAVVEDSGLPDPIAPLAVAHPVQELPDQVLVYLLASRYCEVDSPELQALASKQFGQSGSGWARVQAVCDWVNQHIRFDYNSARATRTALDAYRERVGVCRDYMHLAIALCRVLNIPARYCTGYLGDIGVPHKPPMDFSAWFEVYLGGQWWAFDARNNIPRIGRVLMATGRDAADVALTTSFGLNQLGSFKVWTYVVDESELRAPTMPYLDG